MRNLLTRGPKSAQAMVAATMRTIVDQPDRAAAEAQFLPVVAALQDRCQTSLRKLSMHVGEED